MSGSQRYRGPWCSHHCVALSDQTFNRRRRVELSWPGIYRSNRRPAVSNPLSPIASEFETEEQAASYDRWFRARVQASLDDPRPSIPHDQVMAEMRALIELKRRKRDAN